MEKPHRLNKDERLYQFLVLAEEKGLLRLDTIGKIGANSAEATKSAIEEYGETKLLAVAKDVALSVNKYGFTAFGGFVSPHRIKGSCVVIVYNFHNFWYVKLLIEPGTVWVDIHQHRL